MSEGVFFSPASGQYLRNSTISTMLYGFWNVITGYSFKFALYDSVNKKWYTDLNYTGNICSWIANENTGQEHYRLQIDVNPVANILSLYPNIPADNITELAFYNGTLNGYMTFGLNDEYEYSDPRFTLGVYTVCTSPKTIKINNSTTNIQSPLEQLTITCFGSSSGYLNAVSGYYIQYRDSTNGSSWGSWTNLPNMTTSQAASGYLVDAPAIGVYRQFQIKSKGTVNGYDATSWTVSPTVYRLPISNCSSPSSLTLESTLSYIPVDLIWDGATDGAANTITGYNIQFCDSPDNSIWGSWSESVFVTASPLEVSPPDTIGHYRKFRVQTCGSAGEDYYSDWFTSDDAILRKDMAPFEGFTDPELTALSTKIKAVHMTEMQNRINNLLLFNGKEAYSFTSIEAGKTRLSEWTNHVTEIRNATDVLRPSHEDWLEIVENRPRVDVITQLRDIIIGYCKVTITVNGENGLPEGCTVTVRNMENSSVIAEFVYTEPRTVRIAPGVTYRIECSHSNDYIVSPVSEVMIAQENAIVNIELVYRNAMRYGFKREKANADPSARITYLYDAENFSPISVGPENENPDYGDWETFINEVCRPVMLNMDGTVAYELNHDNQNYKFDGVTASGVSDATLQANAMVEFRKYKWVKRWEDSEYEYVVFSDVKFDNTYNAYAHTNSSGVIQDAFYWGMYESSPGSVSSVGRELRSLSGKVIFTGYGTDTYITWAKNNGVDFNNSAGYGLSYKSGWDYINDLLTLLCKTDDMESIIGQGYTSGSAANSSGQQNDKSAFYGGNAARNSKVLYIENFFGNVSERLEGLLYSTDKGYLVKMTPPYNLTGEGYIETNVFASGTSGECIKNSTNTDAYGWLPTNTGGTSDTYYADAVWWADGGYARVGGGYTNGRLAGKRALLLNSSYNANNTNSTARLTYIPVS